MDSRRCLLAVAVTGMVWSAEAWMAPRTGSSRSRSRCAAASFGGSSSFGDFEPPERSKPKNKKSKQKGSDLSTASMFNEAGLVYENSGHYREAANSYQKAIGEEPWNPIGHGNLANALSEMGMKWYPKCLEEYRTAVMLSLGQSECLVDECSIAAKEQINRQASEYLVNLALSLLHVPADITRYYPDMPNANARADEAFVSLGHAMKLMPDDESIKFVHAISLKEHGMMDDPHAGSDQGLRWSSTFNPDQPDQGQQFLHY